jgi:hypothetical protein
MCDNLLLRLGTEGVSQKRGVGVVSHHGYFWSHGFPWKHRSLSLAQAKKRTHGSAGMFRTGTTRHRRATATNSVAGCIALPIFFKFGWMSPVFLMAAYSQETYLTQRAIAA